MARLVRAIHVFLQSRKVVDAPHKAGHDGERGNRLTNCHFPLRRTVFPPENDPFSKDEQIYASRMETAKAVPSGCDLL